MNRYKTLIQAFLAAMFLFFWPTSGGHVDPHPRTTPKIVNDWTENAFITWRREP